MASGSLPARLPIAISRVEQFGGRPFTVTADSLQKIHEIIMSRVPGKVTFDISYSDGTHLEAVELQRVLADENTERRAIVKIECIYESGEMPGLNSDRIKLSFASDRFAPIELSIASPDRERIWLTVEELQNYALYEVAIHARLPKWVKAVSIACLTTIILWGFVHWGVILVVPPAVHPTLEEAIKSTDPNIKLNYLLLEKSHAYEAHFSSYWALICFSVVVIGGAFSALTMATENAILPKSLLPRSHFAIGKGILRYEKHQHLRSAIVWVVYVGLAINLLAGAIMWLISNTQR